MVPLRALLVLSAFLFSAAPAIAAVPAEGTTCVFQGNPTNGEVYVDIRQSDGDCQEGPSQRCAWIDATDLDYIKSGIGDCPLVLQ